jgi:choline dehydrogenase-like flavoprotein
MGNLNTKGVTQNTYDAIVIGSGMTGGWVAKELCDHGIKTLVLERGKNVTHLKDYPTATMDPWDLPHRNRLPQKVRDENPVVSKCYAFKEDAMHFFVKDKEHPYIQEKPFDWIRGYQVGGKSLMWGRGSHRWNKFNFEAPARDGYAVDWPIRYEDLAPWYSHVEKFVGVCGNKDGLETFPDGEYLPAFDLNVVEKTIQKRIAGLYKDRQMVAGRAAHLTQPTELHLQQGRGKCNSRNLCQRGCPFGGYFSANSSTLPWAAKTGNLTLRPDSVVHSIIYDNKKGKASGVRVIDAQTKQVTEYFANVIFLNAATLNSNLVLLHSTSDRFPEGLGNDNGLLGKYVAFHIYRAGVSADIEGFLDSYYYGRRPASTLIPNFRNVHKHDADFLGGYVSFLSASRSGFGHSVEGEQVGLEYKDAISEPGNWKVSLSVQGETIPKETNHVRLSKDQKDEWGMPTLITSIGYDDNDEKMIKDFLDQGSEMLEKVGCKNIKTRDNHQAPGLDIHEMGGIRMGKDPKTSLLNKWNQLHACKNVFVTDGSCMTSTGHNSPSLTFMTIAARAANHAVEELKKGNI